MKKRNKNGSRKEPESMNKESHELWQWAQGCSVQEEDPTGYELQAVLRCGLALVNNDHPQEGAVLLFAAKRIHNSLPREQQFPKLGALKKSPGYDPPEEEHSHLLHFLGELFEYRILERATQALAGFGPKFTAKQWAWSDLLHAVLRLARCGAPIVPGITKDLLHRFQSLDWDEQSDLMGDSEITSRKAIIEAMKNQTPKNPKNQEEK